MTRTRRHSPPRKTPAVARGLKPDGSLHDVLIEVGSGRQAADDRTTSLLAQP